MGGPGTTDITSFTSASKNAEDPADWDTGPSNVTPKNDIIDCYGHLRRDGTSFSDDLMVITWSFQSFKHWCELLRCRNLCWRNHL